MSQPQRQQRVSAASKGNTTCRRRTMEASYSHEVAPKLSDSLVIRHVLIELSPIVSFSWCQFFPIVYPEPTSSQIEIVHTVSENSGGLGLFLSNDQRRRARWETRSDFVSIDKWHYGEPWRTCDTTCVVGGGLCQVFATTCTLGYLRECATEAKLPVRTRTYSERVSAVILTWF